MHKMSLLLASALLIAAADAQAQEIQTIARSDNWMLMRNQNQNCFLVSRPRTQDSAWFSVGYNRQKNNTKYIFRNKNWKLSGPIMQVELLMFGPNDIPLLSINTFASVDNPSQFTIDQDGLILLDKVSRATHLVVMTSKDESAAARVTLSDMKAGIDSFRANCLN